MHRGRQRSERPKNKTVLIFLKRNNEQWQALVVFSRTLIHEYNISYIHNSPDLDVGNPPILVSSKSLCISMCGDCCFLLNSFPFDFQIFDRYNHVLYIPRYLNGTTTNIEWPIAPWSHNPTVWDEKGGNAKSGLARKSICIEDLGIDPKPRWFDITL